MVVAQGYAVAAYLEDGIGRRLCTVVTAYLVDGSDSQIYSSYMLSRW